jgi:uncharacterized protein YfaS (alpha-2-macroglobulin family)
MPRRPLVAAPLALVTLIVVTSCFQGAKAPQVSPVRTLDLGVEGAGTTSSRPFAVVFGGPHGQTVDPSEISIVFNRPMRPLELAGEESAPPASLFIKGGGAPKGSWRWLGTSALIFAPDARLPRATEFVVTVPAGTKALDGSALKEAYTFELATPPPRLERISPGSGEDHLRPTATFELRFNQPVDPKEVERAAQLRVGDPLAAWPFHATWPKADTRTLVRIAPARPLPLASRVDIDIDSSLHGMEGPLPVGEPRGVSMATYGPLRVTGIDCWHETPHKKCDANGSVRIEMTNAVACKQLKAHVQVSPAVAMNWPSSCDDTANHYGSPYLPAHLDPARSYTVTVLAGMKDEYGQTLPKTVSFPVETDDEWPSASIGLAGSVFEAGGAAGATAPPARIVPIGSVNMSQYELVTAVLDEAGVTEYLTRDNSSRRDDFDYAKSLPKAKVETVRPTGATNVRWVKTVALDTLLADTHGRGAALVGMRAPGRYSPYIDVRAVAATDLAISAKMSRFGSIVWVSRLSDGAPVPHATVVVRTRAGEAFSTRTDEAGIAAIPADRYAPASTEGQIDSSAVLVVREGTDWTFRRIEDLVGEWRYGVSVDPSGRLAPVGMLFTERGVYKPGETVKVKGLFRQPLAKGTRTPAGRTVHLSATDGQGENVFSEDAKLDAYGGFALDVPMPATSHLGNAQLRADIDGGDDGTAPPGGTSTSVLLAAYKPAEFKVTVDPDKSAYVRGDKAAFAAQGDYLFGAPMSGGSVRYTVTRGPGYFVPPGAEELVLDDYAYGWDSSSASLRAGELQSGNGALSDKGQFRAATALTMPGQRGPEMVTFEAEVEDLTRQTIAGRASVVVHPGEFYVAMKPPADFFVSKGATLHPEILAIDAAGAKRSGIAVHIEIIRRSWHTVLEETGESGGHYDSKPVDKTVASCDVTTTAAAAVGCDLAVADAGYMIVRAQAKDKRGNALAASTGLYSLGESADLGWLVSDSTKLDLVPDKKAYEIGQTARVLVKSPFHDADALVTVERAGVYRQERITLAGATPTLSIPITEDMRPNAYVAVELVRGRMQAAPSHGPDPGAPTYRIGYAELSVNPEARRLKVAVSPAHKEYGPGQTVDADVAVLDRAGKPVRTSVTFYAVDEGVLMLTGYKTPDPIPVFTAPRALAVFSIESRDDLAKILFRAGEVGGDKGRDGGGGGEDASVRQDFRATAYFEPSLVTGADGKAHVRFKLPDGLTTYRLMAVVAGQDDRFGFGESQVVTSRPLMARPAMPRFLRAGDSVDAGIVLTSKGMPASNVEVTLDAKGVVVNGDAKRVVALPANGSVEVRWPIASPTSGKASFTWTARAGKAVDEVRVEREVEVPLSPEAVALYGDTSQAAGERLGDLSAMRSDVGGLDLRLASTALVGLEDGIEQLVEYPYGCTEQLSSRLVPLIPLRALAEEYHAKLPVELDGVIDDAVARIVKNQLGDGSFGYWVDSPRGYVWLTAYALWALHLASQHGHHIPDGVEEHATRYLRAELPNWERSPYTRAEAPFVLDVLAEVGSPDAGYMDRVYEKRADLPLFSRALLAHAMALAKTDKAEMKELLRDADNHLRVTPTGATVAENVGDDYAPLMDSEARTTAMVLRALVAMDKNHPLAARLAKGLLALRKGGTWRSTQETAWSLLALDDYRHAQEKDPPDFEAAVFLNDTQIFTAPFHERTTRAATTSLSAARLFESRAGGSTLAFDVDGKGTLFYEARLRYAKKELPREGLDRGFFVRKLVRSVRPEALHDALATIPQTSAISAHASDLVLVDLLVVTPDPREQVVIDDPLPAGLEAVQASFETTAKTLDVTDSGGEGDSYDQDKNDDEGDARANDRAYNFAWYHREVHDDRVLTFVEHMAAGMYHYRYLARATTIGRFVVPPTRAECMYEPETFGRTGAVTFEVTGK